MESMLEQFWYFYLSEHPHETDPDQRLRLDEILKREDALRKTFTPEQNELFLAYNDAVGTYRASAESAIFQRGVRCAVQFLAESIRAIS